MGTWYLYNKDGTWWVPGTWYLFKLHLYRRYPLKRWYHMVPGGYLVPEAYRNLKCTECSPKDVGTSTDGTFHEKNTQWVPGTSTINMVPGGYLVPGSSCTSRECNHPQKFCYQMVHGGYLVQKEPQKTLIPLLMVPFMKWVPVGYLVPLQ